MVTAKDIMNTQFHSLLPTTSLTDAIKLFKHASEQEERRVFGIMVIDENGKLVGILSMEDILLFAQPKHIHIWGDMSDIDVSGIIDNVCEQSKSILVGDIMSTGIVTVDTDTHLFSILAKMNQRHIRRIPVVEKNEVVGIVYISDLFFHLLKQLT